MEGAKIYAQNAIREKNQALNYLRLSSRIDSVAQRVDTAAKMGSLTKTMGKVVKGMENTLCTMNIENISKVMDTFESQLEDLDIRSAYMTDTMDQTTSATTPEDEVSNLIKMVADEHGLKVASNLDDAGLISTSVTEQVHTDTDNADENDLAARLAALVMSD